MACIDKTDPVKTKDRVKLTAILQPNISNNTVATFFAANCLLREETISFVTPVRLFVRLVRPHGTTRLPLDGFLRNLTFENFPKICREQPSLMKI